jgi:hypothetical protein
MLTEQRKPVRILLRGPGTAEKQGLLECVRIAHPTTDERAEDEGSRSSEKQP